MSSRETHKGCEILVETLAGETLELEMSRIKPREVKRG